MDAHRTTKNRRQIISTQARRKCRCSGKNDFWVVWLLAQIFSQPELGDHAVFKGGTSLSKVFGVITRFSEDIDLGISPERLGWSEDMLDTASKSIDSHTTRGRTNVELGLRNRSLQPRRPKRRGFLMPKNIPSPCARFYPPRAFLFRGFRLFHDSLEKGIYWSLTTTALPAPSSTNSSLHSASQATLPTSLHPRPNKAGSAPPNPATAPSTQPRPIAASVAPPGSSTAPRAIA